MTARDSCPNGLPSTPLPIDNPPGQPALRARIGTFGSFRRTLLDRLSTRPELAALTTRDPDDHSIALLEQWAVLADLLTFYNERYANEAYLATATRDESLHRLVRLVGYRPRPGISATTTLAFTLDPGKALTVPAGFPVLSVPGAPGERPQTFETLQDCAADWRYNSLPAYGPPIKVDDPPRESGGALLDPHAVAAWIDRLRPGAVMLLVVESTLDDGGHLVTSGSVTSTVVHTVSAEPVGLRVALRDRAPGTDPVSVFRPRRELLLNGHDAPYVSPPTATKDDSRPGGVSWNWGQPVELEQPRDALFLEAKYQDLPVGTWLLVTSSEDLGLTQVVTAQHIIATQETLWQGGPTTQATIVTFTPKLWSGIQDRRSVRVMELDGPPIEWLQADYVLPIGGGVWIPGVLDDMAEAVRVVGPPGADTADVPVLSASDFARGRPVVLGDDAGHAVATTVLGPARLEPPYADPGDRAYLVIPVTATPDETAVLSHTSTRLLGNAAPASHGSTVHAEILGSGDASAEFQRFALAKAPLTRIPSATPEGSTAALTVRVNGLAYAEVPRLLDAGAKDEVYELRTEPDGSTTVQFGDGSSGARPRTGQSNIVAGYRYGTGLVGRVRAGSLTQPQVRLPGLAAVVNPAAALGGADAEDGGDLRDRAPGTARLLGRAVSAADCADVLTATGQVAKARSMTVWDGRGMLIAVTVAGQEGGAFDPDNLRLLAKVVASASPPYRRVVVQNYAAIPVQIAATVTPDPRADGQVVLAGVRAALTDRLSFARTTLARPLHLSDTYLAVSTVPGAAAVNITMMAFRRPAGMTDREWADFLAAHGADPEELIPERLRLLDVRPDPTGGVLPAELPVLDDGDLTVTLAAALPLPTTGGFE